MTSGNDMFLAGQALLSLRLLSPSSSAVASVTFSSVSWGARSEGVVSAPGTSLPLYTCPNGPNIGISSPSLECNDFPHLI